jgi:hypothetical protein
MYFGGEGHDYIKGGSRGTDSKIWGGSGDDFIRSGEKLTSSVVVKAGKGDDIINETVYNEETEQFGIYRQYIKADGTIDVLGDGEEFIATYGEERNAEEKFYGEQGDDKIWIGGKIAGNAFAHGGTGDDTIYGGYKVDGNSYLYGNAGRDTIRTDWWEINGDGTIENTGNEYIYGDYKYGADNLDKDLWGDADIIYGG